VTTVVAGFRDTFRSLRHRNFRLFFFGQFVSQTGSWITLVAMTLLVLELTGSGVMLGVLAACQFGPVLLLGPWAGTVADRSDKRKLLLYTQGAAMAQSLGLGIIVLTGNARLSTVFPLALIQGIIISFDNPARRAFVVEMVDTDDVANAVSLNSALMTGSRVIGPAAAGLLVLLVGYGWAFIIDGISYLSVLWALWLMRPTELFSSAPALRARGQIRDGLRYVARNRELFIPLMMMVMIGTLAFNFPVTAPLLVKGPLGGSDQAYTLLLATMSVGALIGALATARRRTIPSRHLVLSAVLFGAGMMALAVVPELWAAYPVALVIGLGSIGFMTSSTALVQLFAAPEYRGRVLALQSMVFLGSAPFGGPLVGWIADTFGPRSSVMLGAVACFAAAGWAHRAWKRPLRVETETILGTGEIPIVGDRAS
jgi:MFS family permease